MFFSKLVKNSTLGWLLDIIVLFHFLALIVYVYLSVADFQEKRRKLQVEESNKDN